MNAIVRTARGFALLLIAATCTAKSTEPPQPWMNTALSPDARADLVIAQMTLDEKIQLVHGTGWGVLRAGEVIPPRSNLGAGFVAAWISRGRKKAATLTGIALLGLFIPNHYLLWDKFPVWYHLTFLVSLLPLTLLGAALNRRTCAKAP